MKEKILFKDKAGNILTHDGKKFGVRNKNHRLVTIEAFEDFVTTNKLILVQNGIKE